MPKSSGAVASLVFGSASRFQSEWRKSFLFDQPDAPVHVFYLACVAAARSSACPLSVSFPEPFDRPLPANSKDGNGSGAVHPFAAMHGCSAATADIEIGAACVADRPITAGRCRHGIFR